MYIYFSGEIPTETDVKIVTEVKNVSTVEPVATIVTEVKNVSTVQPVVRYYYPHMKVVNQELNICVVVYFKFNVDFLLRQIKNYFLFLL